MNDGVTADYYVRKLDENGDVDSTFGTGGDTPIPSGFRWFTGHVGGYLA